MDMVIPSSLMKSSSNWVDSSITFGVQLIKMEKWWMYIFRNDGIAWQRNGFSSGY
jgi:hypothetical protein